MFILVFNAGSSSLRFSLFDQDLKLQYKGHVDGIGQKKPQYRWTLKNAPEKTSPQNCKTMEEAFKIAMDHLQKDQPKLELNSITHVGHRVVHGGTRFKNVTLVNATTLRAIKNLSPLAPLHNPINLQGIVLAKKHLPKAKHFAVFDTAFHHSLTEENTEYAINSKIAKKNGWRRFGFHGISHEYVSREAQSTLKKHARTLITCHIGNGVSLCAIKNGKSIDTTMGFTPLEGPCMGTRSGTLDPGLVLEMVKKQGLDWTQEQLWHESGLKGLSGLSSDVRVLRADSKNIQSKRALKIMAHQISKQMSSLFASLKGLPSAIVFTAGIGENAPYLRSDVLKPFESMGIRIDPTKNRQNASSFQSKESKVKLLIIPTQEELQIARSIRQFSRKTP